jgi:hypothetical protein
MPFSLECVESTVHVYFAHFLSLSCDRLTEMGKICLRGQAEFVKRVWQECSFKHEYSFQQMSVLSPLAPIPVLPHFSYLSLCFGLPQK